MTGVTDSPDTKPRATPGGSGPSRPVTSAKGHGLEDGWAPGPAQPDADCGGRQSRGRQGQEWARYKSWQGPTLPGLACRGSGVPGVGGGRRPLAMRVPPCSTGPWPVALTALCINIPCLKANYFLLLKRCRYFYIYLYGTRRRCKPVYILHLYH